MEATYMRAKEGALPRTSALARGLSVLEELARVGRPLRLPELTRDTGLPKSTLVRLLAELHHLGYVVRLDDQPTYWLGQSVMPLSQAYLDVLDISASATEALRGLAEATGQTANLGVLDGCEVVHLAVVESERPLRFRAVTGSRDGAYHTGLGKLLLAYVPVNKRNEHLPVEPYPARTEKTLTTRVELDRQLAVVRRRGYAEDSGEGDVGVGCLAVPLVINSEVLAAISITGPVAEIAASGALASQLEHLAGARDELARESQCLHALTLVRTSLS